MLKRMYRIHYTYEENQYTLTELYQAEGKKRGWVRTLAFIRDCSRSKNWLASLYTNAEPSDEEIIRLHGKRWDIECFFKMEKSYLALGKEFQFRKPGVNSTTSVVMSWKISVLLKQSC